MPWPDEDDRALEYTDTMGGIISSAAGPISKPTDIAGCVLWLDAADSSSITVATGVSQWIDKSGQNNNVTQSTGSKQPAYPGANPLNSLNTVRFNGGAAQVLGSAASLWPAGSDLSSGSTLFVVVYPQNAGLNTYQPYVRFPSTNGTAIQYNSSGDPTIPSKIIAFISTTGPGSPYIAVPTSTVTTNVWRIDSFIVDTVGLTITLLSNNATIGAGPVSFTGTISSTVGDTCYIGSDGAATSDNAFADIAEIIIYKSTLSTFDQGRVCNYLSGKWAITLGTGVP